MILLFAPAAAAEHLAQVEYYESKQPGLGARCLADVVAALDYILASPRSFPIVRPPSLRRLVLRRFPFSIVFRGVSGEHSRSRDRTASPSAGLLEFARVARVARCAKVRAQSLPEENHRTRSRLADVVDILR